MAGKREPEHEYQRKRGGLNRFLERVSSIPENVLGGAVSDAAKRKLYEEGIPGRAEVLKAPSKRGVSEVQTNMGTFHVRVKPENGEPYETKTRQSFGRYEWEQLQKGAVVECRIDPDKPERVLLITSGDR